MENRKEYLEQLGHTCAHLLAKAVLTLWPGSDNAIGPAIENGFYQDFDMGRVKISDDNFPKIEKEMRKILSNWKHFEYREVSLEEARKLFRKNPYKVALAEEFAGQGKKLTVNDPGDFLDLCKMTHVDNPSDEMQNFKLLSVAGAYWRGSEKNKMLTRIYGTCFPSKEELDRHLEMLEKAKLYDHRKLGRELELFTIVEEVGPGLILWLPKGNIIKEEIEKWAKDTEKDWGYQRVTTPNITKSGLYYTSGHLPYYKGDMYPPMKGEDGEEYYLKPMNCPHHHMIYSSKTRSYKDLPLRLAEYGTCYRYEASGELFGMLRVRGFTQNDSHIYCTQEEAVGEFVNVMKLHEYYYKALGINEYHLELCLRDPKNKEKYHGDEKMWVKAEELMRKACAKVDIPMVENLGSAAFYGPKIDFIIKSSIGREFGISTNQIDLFMGERFRLKYTDKDGSQKTPVIIHRAPLGSHERFIGFLIEHFGGAFPIWLSPVQVKILPISEKNIGYATEVLKNLRAEQLRVELDERNETLQARIRDAQIQKIPYMVIVGEKEEKDLSISLRLRNGEDLEQLPLAKFVKIVKDKIESKNLDL